MQSVGATSLQELQSNYIPPVNLSSWPESVFNGSQLFSGFFLDEGLAAVMPVPPLQRFISGSVNVNTLVFGTNSKDGTVQFYTWPDGSAVVPEWNASAKEYERAIERPQSCRWPAK